MSFNDKSRLLFQCQPFERALRDIHAVMGQIALQRGEMEDAVRLVFDLAPLSPTF